MARVAWELGPGHFTCLAVGLVLGLALRSGSYPGVSPAFIVDATSPATQTLDDSRPERLPMCSSPVTILSLDGGGMRGLIGATILEELEAVLSEKTGQDVPVGDFFDVVVGTSTGGLQALTLLLGQRAARLSQIYMVDGKRIFGNDTVNCKPEHLEAMREHCSLDFYDLGGLIYECLPAVAHCYLSYPTYDSSGIEAVANEYLGHLTTADDFGGRVFGLTTYDILRGAPVTFSNLGASPSSTYRLSDAALATSAAPTFFNPRRMTCINCSDSSEEILAVDGALYANNPALIAYELAERMAAERRGCQLTPDRALVLSLGTGREQSDLYSSGNVNLEGNTLGSVIKTVVQFLEYNDTKWWDEQWGTLKWIFLPLTFPRLELLSAALTGQEELTDQFFRKVFASAGAAHRYLRINVDLSRLQRTSPFDAGDENVEALRGIGLEASESTRHRLVEFAEELLALRPSLLLRTTGDASGARRGTPSWTLDGVLACGLGSVLCALAVMALMRHGRPRYAAEAVLRAAQRTPSLAEARSRTEVGVNNVRPRFGRAAAESSADDWEKTCEREQVDRSDDVGPQQQSQHVPALVNGGNGTAVGNSNQPPQASSLW